MDAQALTVRAALDSDRDAVYHAVMQDPIAQARLTLDEVWRMTDELIDRRSRAGSRPGSAASDATDALEGGGADMKIPIGTAPGSPVEPGRSIALAVAACGGVDVRGTSPTRCRRRAPRLGRARRER